MKNSNVEWVTLEMILDHSVILVVAPKYISDTVDFEGYAISSMGFLTTSS